MSKKKVKVQLVQQPYHLFVRDIARWICLAIREARKETLSVDERHELETLQEYCTPEWCDGVEMIYTLSSVIRDLTWVIDRVIIPTTHRRCIRDALRSLYAISGNWMPWVERALRHSLVGLGANPKKLRRPRKKR